MACSNKTIDLIAAGTLDPCTMTNAEIIAAYQCANETDLRILDRVFNDCCCSKWLPAFSSATSVQAVSDDTDTTITLTLSAAQIAEGFTTDHIVGTVFIAVDGTKELWLTDTSAKAPTTITFRLSGTEDTNNGHELTILLMK